MKLRTAILLAALLSAASLPAANRYVRAGAAGANTGADWTNAWTALPGNLVRGDTYYVADGTYAGLRLDDAESGSLVITIRKATAADHGTATGWQGAYGDGQAVFSGWSWITNDYYVLDGQERSGWKTGYGFKLTAPADGLTLRLDDSSGAGTLASGSHHLAFRFLEFDGAGYATADGIYSLGRNTDITIQSCYFHDYGRTHVLSRNWDTVLTEHTYFARNQSSAELHGESWSDMNSINFIYRYNVTEDCEGTAIIFTRVQPVSNWQVYGNVFWWTAGYNAEGISGLIISDGCIDWNVHNNTIYNAKGLYSGLRLNETASSNVKVYNNIWWSCVRTDHQFGDYRYNLYYNTTNNKQGTGDVLWSGANLFASAAGGDFQLALATPAGTAVPAPYDRDASGRTRGADGVWDRGAFEYAVGLPSRPAAPLNLRVGE